ncbi:MAG: hypothetical protein ACRD2I_24860 [Vicinamibacterales bacterium]
MAIVLAIEPDRRQAAHLTAIVRNQVGVELVVADTTEGALDAIGNRVPDLVLVPALLSPQDDAALAAALRVIAAAAHVRTLTIPVLSNGTKRAATGGMLAKWRKSRAASPEPDGCDPAVFGEQISAYLQEAAAERAQLEEDALLNEEAVEAAASFQGVDLPLQADAPAPASGFQDDIALTGRVAEIDALEPVAEVEYRVAAEPFERAEVSAVVEPAQPETSIDRTEVAALIEHVEVASLIEHVEAAVSVEGLDGAALTGEIEIAVPSEQLESLSLVQAAESRWSDAERVESRDAGPVEELTIDTNEPSIDLSDELAGLSRPAPEETFDGEPVGVYTIASDDDRSVFDALDFIPGILEPPSIAEDVEAALDQIAAAARVQPRPASAKRRAAKSARSEAAMAPVIEAPEPARADITPWVPMYLIPGRIWPAMEGMPAETPVARTEQPDWIELVASLRQDLERRRTDPSSTADPIAARPSDGATAKVHRLAKKPRPLVRKAKPVQDEWGFFDPERCGFSTLLAKLEEITEEDARP